MLSPRSRGKGGRRFPGRDGGRGKQRLMAPWQKCANHAVDSFTDTQQEIATVSFYLGSVTSEATIVYRFDQRAAREGFPYQFEVIPAGFKSFVFVVRVPALFKTIVEAIVAELKRK